MTKKSDFVTSLKPTRDYLVQIKNSIKEGEMSEFYRDLGPIVELLGFYTEYADPEYRIELEMRASDSFGLHLDTISWQLDSDVPDRDEILHEVSSFWRRVGDKMKVKLEQYSKVREGDDQIKAQKAALEVFYDLALSETKKRFEKLEKERKPL
jgi:hypothetical protein